MFEKILALIFPPNGEARAIETMSPSAFSQEATRVLDELPQGIYSLFHYKDPLVKQALWALKYRGSRPVAKLFATLLYETILEHISDALLFENVSEPLLLSLPLSEQRLKERGWNQAELICEEIIKLYPQLHYNKNILKKIKHTAPQTTLSRKERLLNLKNCFGIDSGALHLLQNRNIILLDDVTTTGSTLKEARATLIKAGARKVLCFTVAH